ncbi:phosphoglycerate dehydrogenase [Apiospora arundinis]
MAPTAIHDVRVATGSPGKPRILVPEKVSPDGLSMLASDFEVDLQPGLSAEELLKAIPSYHGLIVRSETKVTAKILAAGIKLRVVARAGVGVDNIDVDAATAQGIIVVNSPSGNIVAAAEHTVALLLATARNIGRADRSFKEGKWERSKLVGVEVGHKTLGIIGLGKVGMKVARMCVGLGMKVLAVDPYASSDLARQANVDLVASLADLLPMVDFLTIHTPLLASTLDLLGEEEFKQMKKTARVLNVARGGVYNEAALLKALEEGWIAGAGLDVFTKEPPEEGSVAAQLARHPKVVSTPHLGASTVEAQENVSLDVCGQVLLILKGGLPTSAVNAPLILPEEYRKLQPFVKLIEKMGGLYTQHYVGAKGKMLGGRKFELVGSSRLSPIQAAGM